MLSIVFTIKESEHRGSPALETLTKHCIKVLAVLQIYIAKSGANCFYLNSQYLAMYCMTVTQIELVAPEKEVVCFCG